MSIDLFSYFPISIKDYKATTLPKKWMESIYYLGLFKLFVPEKLNGRECSMEQGLIMLFVLSEYHGSLGWTVNLGAGAGYFAGCLGEKEATAIYGGYNAVVAGSDSLASKVLDLTKFDMITGRWEFCTGAAHATHFTVNFENKKGEIMTAAIRAGDIRIKKQYPFFGLKATSTYQISCDNAIAFKGDIFKIGKLKSFKDYRVYQLDFNLFSRLCIATSFCGIASGFCKEAARNKPKGDKNLMHMEMRVKLLWDNLLNFSALIDNRDPKPEEKNEMEAHIFEMVPEIVELAQTIVTVSPMIAVDERFPIHWFWRDLLTASTHRLLQDL